MYSVLTPPSARRQVVRCLGATWQLLVITLLVFEVVLLPVQTVFDLRSRWLLPLEAIVIAVFAIDLLHQTLRRLLSKRRKPKAFKHYMSSWFVPDLLAAVPFELVVANLFLSGVVGAPSQSGINYWHLLGLLRFPKLFRLQVYWGALQRNHRFNPVGVKLAFFVFAAALTIHWIACSWVWMQANMQPKTWSFETYIDSLYWCVTTITTVGYGDITPDSTTERMYAMLMMFCGVLLYGYVVGNVVSLLANLNRERIQFNAKLQEVSGFLKNHGVPMALKKRIYNYYHYLWEHGSTNRHESRVMNELPDSLREEVLLLMNEKLLGSVALLKGIRPSFMEALVKRMQMKVYMPGDVVLRREQEGKGVYVIGKGEVSFLNEKDEVVKNLKQAQTFGESFLLPGPRERGDFLQVEATQFCELYFLSERSLRKTLSESPEFAEDLPLELVGSGG